MIGGDYNERIAVFFRKIERQADGAVEVLHLFDDVFGVVVVAAPVDLGAFDHEEEAFFVLRQHIQRQFRGIWQEIAPPLPHFVHAVGCQQVGVAGVGQEVLPKLRGVYYHPASRQGVEKILAVLPLDEVLKPAASGEMHGSVVQ